MTLSDTMMLFHFAKKTLGGGAGTAPGGKAPITRIPPPDCFKETSE